MSPLRSFTTVMTLVICMASVMPVWGQQYQLYAPQPVTSSQKNPDQEGIIVKEITVQKGDTLYALSHKFIGRGMYFPQILLFNDIKTPNLIYPGDVLKIPLKQNGADEPGATATVPPAIPHKKKIPAVKSPRTNRGAEQTSVRPPIDASVSALNTEIPLGDLKTVVKSKNSPRHSGRKKPVYAKKTESITSPESIVSPDTADSKDAPMRVPYPKTVDSKDDAEVLQTALPTGQKLFETAMNAYRGGDCHTALKLLDNYLSDNPGSELAADANLYKAECYLKLSTK